MPLHAQHIATTCKAAITGSTASRRAGDPINSPEHTYLLVLLTDHQHVTLHPAPDDDLPNSLNSSFPCPWAWVPIEQLADEYRRSQSTDQGSIAHRSLVRYPTGRGSPSYAYSHLNTRVDTAAGLLSLGSGPCTLVVTNHDDGLWYFGNRNTYMFHCCLEPLLFGS